MQTKRMDMWTRPGEGRVEHIGRLGLTYHYHVENREQVGSCCLTQGAQLGAL